MSFLNSIPLVIRTHVSNALPIIGVTINVISFWLLLYWQIVLFHTVLWSVGNFKRNMSLTITTVFYKCYMLIYFFSVQCVDFLSIPPVLVCRCLCILSWILSSLWWSVLRYPPIKLLGVTLLTNSYTFLFYSRNIVWSLFTFKVYFLVSTFLFDFWKSSFIS